jgi:hypothetical protein
MNELSSMAMAFVLACGALTGCGGDDPDPTDPVDDGRAAVQAELRGRWLTACSPVQNSDPPAFFQLEVVNNGERGTFRYSEFSDASCAMPLLDLVLESRQEIGAALPSVGPSVYELNIYYEKQTATAHVQPVADAMMAAGCGSGPLTLGEPMDTAQTGCFILKPIKTCPADYDITKIEDDKFYNGVRTADMCTPAGRPTALNTFWFDRVE